MRQRVRQRGRVDREEEEIGVRGSLADQGSSQPLPFSVCQGILGGGSRQPFSAPPPAPGASISLCLESGAPSSSLSCRQAWPEEEGQRETGLSLPAFFRTIDKHFLAIESKNSDD